MEWAKTFIFFFFALSSTHNKLFNVRKLIYKIVVVDIKG